MAVITLIIPIQFLPLYIFIHLWLFYRCFQNNTWYIILPCWLYHYIRMSVYAVCIHCTIHFLHIIKHTTTSTHLFDKNILPTSLNSLFLSNYIYFLQFFFLNWIHFIMDIVTLFLSFYFIVVFSTKCWCYFLYYPLTWSFSFIIVYYVPWVELFKNFSFWNVGLF